MTWFSKAAAAFCVLSLCSSPQALAKKQPRLNFQKQTVPLKLPTIGEMMRLDEGTETARLLIQSGRSFSYIADITKVGLPEQIQSIEIPDNVLFYNKGFVAGNPSEVLFYFTGDEVLSFDLTSKALQKHLTVESFYQGQTSEVVRRSQFVVDANGDGLSDILVSDFQHANLYIQTDEGKFEAQKLILKPDSRVGEDGVSFSAHQTQVSDTNGDGRTDLIVRIEDKLQVFIQNEQKHFAEKPVAVPLNAGVLTRAKRAQLRAEGKKPEFSVRVEELIDLNNDGLLDLVTKEEKRDGLMSSTSKFPVRFGQLKDGMLFYPKAGDTIMKFEGQGDIKFDDVNNDGLQDYFTISMELGVGAVMSLMSGSFDMDLRFYKMDAGQTYAEKPAYDGELTLSVDMDDSEGDGFEPLLAVKDFNGDGIKDLIKQTDDDEFKIYNGNDGGKRMFHKRGAKYDIDLPTKGRVEVDDFNGDGKADLLFLFSGGKEKSKLTLWLSAV